MLKHLGLLCASVCFAAIAAAAPPAPLAPSAAPATPTTTWEEGKNYFLIDPPQPTASGRRVEVLEIFSYACPHCAHFQPYAEKIKQSLPAYATFDYMPAAFNPSWEPFARAYYAAQSLGVLEQTHQALYDALHRDHIPMRTIDELAGFYAQSGVDKAKFLSAASSFETESKLRRAADIVKGDGIEGTPSVVVNGKYRITGESAGGYDQMIDLINYLVKKEHDPAAKPKAAAK
ncbi:MAG: thiol:disulfide interchange protein DsbA/DsbL [Rhodanobacter sp.]|jgi:thiol:disulfide interchange protein DsbA|nr:thiol:disulfide interchange protein DsbA/DsbL [Rhodanobacter sp.]